MHFNIKGQEPHSALRALSTLIHTVWQNKSAVWTHRSNPRWNDSLFNFIRVDVRYQNLKFKHLGIYIQLRLCLYQTLLCIFICFSNCQHKKMHRYTACICLAFIHCTFSNELLDCLQVRIQSHIALWRKPLRNLELRILPKWWPWLSFSHGRIISDRNIWMLSPLQFHFQFIFGYELKTVFCSS